MFQAKFFIVLVVVTMFLLLSCENNESVVTSPTNSLLGQNPRLSISDIYSEYYSIIDTSSVVGWMYLSYTKDYFPYKYGTDSLTDLQYSSYVGRIALSDSIGDQSLPLGLVLVNNTQFEQIIPDIYGYFAAGDPESSTGLQLNFGSGTNNILINANQYFSGVDTSISLSEKVSFNNIEFNDTISKSQPFTVLWNNSSTSYASISLMAYHENENSGNIGGNILVYNNGSHTFMPTELSSLKNGLNSIKITVYEPKFLIDADGRIIIINAYSSYNTHIYLTN